MLKQLILCVLLAAAAGGCSKGPSAGKGSEASLPELSRALQTWVVTKGSYPNDLSELTNFPALRGKRLPAAPPGKKLGIDPATRQVVFLDQ
jgi:hypothetical protein